MSEEQQCLLAVGGLMFVVYGLALSLSLSKGQSLWPYQCMLGLHALTCAWLGAALAGVGRGGSDAAGKGLAAGLTWLIWIAVNVGLALVAIVVLVVRRRSH